MIISNKCLKSSFNININNTEIKCAEYVKYLGILLDYKLSWKSHVSSLYSKILKVCGVFYKLTYEVCLKSIGTVCFAQTTLATVIKALFFKMAQCLVVVKM